MFSATKKLQPATKTVLWHNPQLYSSEYFTLSIHADRIELSGKVILMLEEIPSIVTYTVECDFYWKTQKVSILQERGRAQQEFNIRVDDEQNWFTGYRPVEFATGLYDVDLEISPSTNTLPIQRRPLKVGEAMEINAVWVRFPSLTLEPLRQRYTRVSPLVYRYQALDHDFEAMIEVDEPGLVIDYRGHWRRGNV
jgi:uncharacterized protein